MLENLQYTKDHEWLKADAGLFLVGLTDHAQDSMGDVVFIELPSCPTRVQRGDVVAMVESVKAVSEVYAPISGEVVEINSALISCPGILNSSPYKDGWIFKIKSSEYEKEALVLISAKAYQEILAST